MIIGQALLSLRLRGSGESAVPVRDLIADGGFEIGFSDEVLDGKIASVRELLDLLL